MFQSMHAPLLQTTYKTGATREWKESHTAVLQRDYASEL